MAEWMNKWILLSVAFLRELTWLRLDLFSCLAGFDALVECEHSQWVGHSGSDWCNFLPLGLLLYMSSWNGFPTPGYIQKKGRREEGRQAGRKAGTQGTIESVNSTSEILICLRLGCAAETKSKWLRPRRFFFFFACDRCPAFVSKGTVLFVVTESAQEDDRMLPLSLPWRKGVWWMACCS